MNDEQLEEIVKIVKKFNESVAKIALAWSVSFDEMFERFRAVGSEIAHSLEDIEIPNTEMSKHD